MLVGLRSDPLKFAPKLTGYMQTAFAALFCAMALVAPGGSAYFFLSEFYGATQITNVSLSPAKSPVICQQSSVGMSMPLIMNAWSPLPLASECEARGGAFESNRFPVTFSFDGMSVRQL